MRATQTFLIKVRDLLDFQDTIMGTPHPKIAGLVATSGTYRPVTAACNGKTEWMYKVFVNYEPVEISA